MRKHLRSRDAVRAACIETLERRRLLAVSFDPAFGGGFVRLPTGFSFWEEGAEQPKNLLLQSVGQLGDGYFASALFQTDVGRPGGDNGNGVVNETIHALVTAAGEPAAGLDGDDDADGLVQYPDVLISDNGYNYNYLAVNQTIHAPDGSLLALPAYTSDAATRNIGRFTPGGSFDSGWGVHFELGDPSARVFTILGDVGVIYLSLPPRMIPMRTLACPGWRFLTWPLAS